MSSIVQHHYNKKLENTMPVEVFLHLGFRTSCKACDNISLVLFKGFFSAFDIHMKLMDDEIRVKIMSVKNVSQFNS